MTTENKNILRRASTTVTTLIQGLLSRQWGLHRNNNNGDYSDDTYNLKNDGGLFCKDEQGRVHEFLEKKTLENFVGTSISEALSGVVGGVVYRGEWSSTTSYLQREAVSYTSEDEQGGVAIYYVHSAGVTSTTPPPDDPNNYTLMLEGAVGETGAKGEKGDKGDPAPENGGKGFSAYYGGGSVEKDSNSATAQIIELKGNFDPLLSDGTQAMLYIKEYDDDDAFDLATGVYTVPRTGKYLVSIKVVVSRMQSSELIPLQVSTYLRRTNNTSKTYPATISSCMLNFNENISSTTHNYPTNLLASTSIIEANAGDTLQAYLYVLQQLIAGVTGDNSIRITDVSFSISETVSGGGGGGDVNDFTKYPYIPQTLSPEGTEGVSYYDNRYKTLRVLSSADKPIAVGNELVLLCHNGTGYDIPKGRVANLTGGVFEIDNDGEHYHPQIILAGSGLKSECSNVGVTYESIEAGAFGLVMLKGVLTEVYTTGLTVNALCYLHATARGIITSYQPSYPKYSVKIGYVMRVDNEKGVIVVNPDTDPQYQTGTAVSAGISTFNMSQIKALLNVSNSTTQALYFSTVVVPTSNVLANNLSFYVGQAGNNNGVRLGIYSRGSSDTLIAQTVLNSSTLAVGVNTLALETSVTLLANTVYLFAIQASLNGATIGYQSDGGNMNVPNHLSRYDSQNANPPTSTMSVTAGFSQTGFKVWIGAS